MVASIATLLYRTPCAMPGHESSCSGYSDGTYAARSLLRRKHQVLSHAGERRALHFTTSPPRRRPLHSILPRSWRRNCLPSHDLCEKKKISIDNWCKIGRHPFARAGYQWSASLSMTGIIRQRPRAGSGGGVNAGGKASRYEPSGLLRPEPVLLGHRCPHHHRRHPQQS